MALNNSKKQNSCCAKVNSSPKTVIPKQTKSNVKKQSQIGSNRKQSQIRSNLKQISKNSSKHVEQPPNLRVWRKTIVFYKSKPKIRVPKLFRADRLTGLPVDYERTVSRIMHYVNPQLSSNPSSEKQLEKLLAHTLAGFMDSCSNRCPQYIKNHMRTILRCQGSRTSKKDRHTDNELTEFHCACKRGPVFFEPQAPTYKSKFNYNSLKIKT